MSLAKQFNISDAEFEANPYPLLKRLRREQPVCQIVLPDETSAWLLTRYEDVNSLLKDARFAKNQRETMTAEQIEDLPEEHFLLRAHRRNLLSLDAPDHTRLRALVHKAFSPRMIEQIQTRTEVLARELLERVAGQREMDIIRDYALPLPTTLITEILGVPIEDRDKFRDWSNYIVKGFQFDKDWRILPVLAKFNQFLREFFETRRANPKNDLISALVQAEEAGDKLSEDELLGMVSLLLIAGHETTVNLIASGVLALLEHPAEMEKLRDDPSLIKFAVEELLRYTAPLFMSTERYAREDVTIRGVTIKRGEMILGAIGAANRDESVFENPDTLDLTREPNKHLSFGQGVHFCLGAPLARMEGQIAIKTILQQMPNLRLKNSPQSLKWRSSLILRGLEKLPVEF